MVIAARPGVLGHGEEYLAEFAAVRERPLRRYPELIQCLRFCHIDASWRRRKSSSWTSRSSPCASTAVTTRIEIGLRQVEGVVEQPDGDLIITIAGGRRPSGFQPDGLLDRGRARRQAQVERIRLATCFRWLSVSISFHPDGPPGAPAVLLVEYKSAASPCPRYGTGSHAGRR